VRQQIAMEPIMEPLRAAVATPSLRFALLRCTRFRLREEMEATTPPMSVPGAKKPSIREAERRLEADLSHSQFWA